MSILNRKRRVKCLVQFTIQELLSVPFINGILFCKLRLVEGGSFISYSSKKEILHSSVVWNFDINFEVKINSNVLNPDSYEPCICRISVRKEIRGGKSFQKLGYIDYNLSDYLNKSETINRVLKEYDSKNRLDNSFLKVKIKVNEQEPSPQQPLIYKQMSSSSSSPIKELIIDNKTSSSSSSSLINHKKDVIDDIDCSLPPTNEYHHHQQISHSRNSSKSSALSFNNEKGHQRNVSNGSTTSNNSSYEATSSIRSNKNKKLIEELQSKDANIRIIETRIDALEIINQVENELVNRNNIPQSSSDFLISSSSSIHDSNLNKNRIFNNNSYY